MASRRKFDSPWKTILEALFSDFVQLFVPEAYTEIDWRVAPRFLDKELSQVIRGAPKGSRSVDQLVEVALCDGSQTWVLVHIEVQSQRDAAFARRMFTYYTRISERFGREPVSLAILADPERTWRPTAFECSRWGCAARLDFIVVKLMDWADRTEELLAVGNPFAIVVAAHLAALAAGRRPESRFIRRKALYRDMRRMGVSQEKAVALMTFMDWVLELPEELDDRFWSEVDEEEGEPTMKYMSRFEIKTLERGRQEGEILGLQRGVAQGLKTGLLEAVELGLELRFGKSALGQMEELSRIESVETLKRVKEALTTVASPAELRSIYAS